MPTQNTQLLKISEDADFYSSSKIINGVSVFTVTASKLNQEFEHQNIIYILILWLASFWAMVTNSCQAIWIKITAKQSTSFSKILWELGRKDNHYSCFFGDRFSPYNHLAKTQGANWRSLDLFYNYQEKVKPNLKGFFEKTLTYHWMEKLENRQAVANRLKIVTELLDTAIKKFSKEKEVRILSIASGSAPAIIEAIKRNSHLKIKAVLIDNDPTAIEQVKKLSEDLNIADCFEFHHGTTTIIEDVCKNFKPHIVEMVGFLDYRPQKKAIILINRIKQQLVDGGLFITCNINKNREKPLLDWVLLWPMIYRTPNELIEALSNGGFTKEKINIIYEPFFIHGIGVCQK